MLYPLFAALHSDVKALVATIERALDASRSREFRGTEEEYYEYDAVVDAAYDALDDLAARLKELERNPQR